jgi:hypothetical protein
VCAGCLKGRQRGLEPRGSEQICVGTGPVVLSHGPWTSQHAVAPCAVVTRHCGTSSVSANPRRWLPTALAAGAPTVSPGTDVPTRNRAISGTRVQYRDIGTRICLLEPTRAAVVCSLRGDRGFVPAEAPSSQGSGPRSYRRLSGSVLGQEGRQAPTKTAAGDLMLTADRAARRGPSRSRRVDAQQLRPRPSVAPWRGSRWCHGINVLGDAGLNMGAHSRTSRWARWRVGSRQQPIEEVGNRKGSRSA